MRVLHIINSLTTGGAEKLILETLPLMRMEGVEVELLLFRTNNFPFEKYFLSETNIKVHKSKYNSFYSPMNIFYIIPFLKKYDIVHVHLFPALYWTAIAKIISFSKTKLVYTEHNTFNRRLGKWYISGIESFVYNRYAKIISISESVNDMLVRRCRIKSSKITLIENGINLENIANAISIPIEEIEKSINNKNKIIIQVSRFQPQKDQKTLIKSMSNLPENVILILVGGGELKSECKDLAKSLCLENRIFFFGQRLDVLRLLKSADIVVLSSFHEGLSLASMEGLASGKPLIASNAPGLKQVVENAGLLFEIGDDIELANHIKRLLDDKTYYDQIAQRCLEKSKKYDIKKMVKAQMELYNNLVN